MAVRGSLRDMSITTLISINCTEGHQSRLRVQHGEQEAFIYFDNCQIVHMESGNLQGEEVIHEILTWEDGTFELETDVPPPAYTVTTPWSSLVLEGLRQLDEKALAEAAEAEVEFPHPETRKEVETMAATPKKRSEVLAELLENLLAQSSDVQGAVVISNDGLVLSAKLPLGGHDAARVGAAGAALVGLTRRTLNTLKSGEFETAILQGKDGWVIAVGAGEGQVVLGLTPPGVNLGMAMIEMRDLAAQVAAAMK